jgi:hypothetical protein
MNAHVNAWKAWKATPYNNGTPVVVARPADDWNI